MCNSGGPTSVSGCCGDVEWSTDLKLQIRILGSRSILPGFHRCRYLPKVFGFYDWPNHGFQLTVFILDQKGGLEFNLADISETWTKSKTH